MGVSQAWAIPAFSIAVPAVPVVPIPAALVVPAVPIPAGLAIPAVLCSFGTAKIAKTA